MNFEWNIQKAASNEKDHKVTFSDAVTVFSDTLSVTYPDSDHSTDENRFLIIRQSALGRILVVAHTFRREVVRIISARKATKRERSFYENQARN